MAINSLYPGFIRYHYTSNGHQHVQLIPVKPFQAVGGAWWLEEKGVIGGDAWATLLALYTAVFKPWLPTTGAVDYADLFTMATPTSTPVFVDTVNIAAAGTASGGAIQPYMQLDMSYRTVAGGRAHFRVMEPQTADAPNVKRVAPFSGVPGALNTYLVGNNSIWCARDGSFLAAPIKYLTKTNDALRKKYLV